MPRVEEEVRIKKGIIAMPNSKNLVGRLEGLEPSTS